MTLNDAFSTAAAVIVSLGGGGVVVLALSSWLGKVWANRILESDRLKYTQMLDKARAELDRSTRRMQATLDHAVFVGRAQFEEEFRSLRGIWKFVARCRATVIAVVETEVPLDDTPENQKNRFFEARNRFGQAHRKLVLAADNNSPFYPEVLYQAVDAFRTRTSLELSRLRTDDRLFTSEWFNERAAAREEIMSLAERVSDAIRRRLESIVIQDASAGAGDGEREA